MRSQHWFSMRKVRAKSIVSATVLTKIVALADIGIGEIRYLFSWRYPSVLKDGMDITKKQERRA